MRSTFSRPQTWLGILVSILALWYAIHGISWTELIEELRGADYLWLLPAALVLVLGQVLRSQRWRLLFAPASRPGLRDAFAILCIGYLVSTVFPLRLGDPFRAWAADHYTPASLVESLATVLVERALDLLSIVLLVALLAPGDEAALLERRFGPGPWSEPALLTWITVGLVLLAYLGLILAAAAGPPLGRAAQRSLLRVGLPEDVAARAGRLVAGFAEGLRPLRRPSRAAYALAWSLAIWLASGAGYWLVMFAFDLGLDYPQAIFVMFGVAVAAILPSTPGYTGVFHAAVVLGLALVADIPREAALSYAVVEHGLITVVLLALGPVGLRLLGMSRRELGASVERSTGAL